MGAEAARLAEDAGRAKYWKRWGPYLAERQWGTVREDYSGDGNVWEYFPHDHARSRTYRWGEDGLLGICDRQARLCFALALWNGRDPILKERLFGLTGPEGNHGEDVKESYFYLDSTPTHSYLKALYKYPQAEFPYEQLVRENRQRGKADPEFELADTGVFDEGRYFDVIAEYAKASPDDIAIRITVANRGPDDATAAPVADPLVSQHVELGPGGRRLLVATRAPPRGPGPDRRRASDAGALRAPGGDGRVGRASRVALHRERDQPHAALRRPQPAAVRKGCHALRGGRGRRRRGQPRRGGHQGGRPLRPPRPGGRRARRTSPASDHAGLQAVRRRVREGAGPARPRSGRVLPRAAAGCGDGGRAAGAPPGVRRTAVEQTVLPLRRRAVGRRRSGAPDASGRPHRGPQHRLAARVHPGHHLDAGQVGVPLVRRLGPGLPHDPLRQHRSPFRQGTASPAAPRVVHASQWPDPGLRVRLRRRQPAGACLGLLAGVQDDGAQGSPRSPLPRARVPQAAAQLHLVGQPEGPGRSEPVRRRLSGARQHRRVRPLAAPADRGAPRAGRRHGVDGLLLQHHARHGAGAGQRGPRVRGRRVQVLRAFHRHLRRDQHAWRDGTLVGRGRLLLRPAPRRQQPHAAPDPVAGRAHAAHRGRGPGGGQVRQAGGVQEAAELVPGEPAGPRPADRVHAAAAVRHGGAAAARDSVARAARAGAAVSAGRDRVPLTPRDPLGLARASGATLPDRGSGHRAPGGLRPRRVEHRALRRQLQLAGPGVVSAQLPPPRGTRAVPPLLRRRPPGRMPGGLGTDADARAGRPGPGGATRRDFPGGCRRPSSVPWDRRAVRQ